MTVILSEPAFRYCGGIRKTVTLDLGGEPKRNGYSPIIQFRASQAAKYPEICAAMRSARMVLNSYRGDPKADCAIALLNEALVGAGGDAE